MKNNTGVQAERMNIGETIQFEDVIINNVFTEYGETKLVKFANNEGKIFRAVFSNSLAKHLEQNPHKKSVTLKKKLKDGELTYNVWA
jgi:hypothetical protein